jgi:hypothetical protein
VDTLKSTRAFELKPKPRIVTPERGHLDGAAKHDRGQQPLETTLRAGLRPMMASLAEGVAGSTMPGRVANKSATSDFGGDRK